MHDTEDRFATALTKCYFCQKDDKIVLNSLLTTYMAKKVKEMHGKIVDMEPCNECREFMKKGVILITIDSERSDKEWYKDKIPNPYRTGGWFVITDAAVRKVIQPTAMADWAITHRWMFIETKAAKMIGLYGHPDYE